MSTSSLPFLSFMFHKLARFVVFLVALLPAMVCAENLVVVINPDSGVEQLSRNDVINIFLGNFRQLPSGITAQPVDLPPAHPDRAEFYHRLVGKSPAEINTYWARQMFSGKTRPPIQTEQFDEALALVHSVEGAVTYMERDKVSGNLKIVFELSK